MRVNMERDLAQLKQDIEALEWAHEQLAIAGFEETSHFRWHQLREIIDWHKEIVAFYEGGQDEQ